MKAVVHHEFGSPDVLHVEEVDRPVPKADEVLVRVHATTVNRTDCGFRDPSPFLVRLFTGLRRPRHPVLGTELAGTVEEVGSAVTEFAVGDEVFGVNADRFGAHAELVRVRQRAPLAPKPRGLTFEEAAAVCDGVVLALTCLRWAKVGPGQRVVVYGASGSIGTAGVQLAKHLGADVTAVCTARNVDLVRSLGANDVIDYERDDFTATGDAYDVIFDAVGKLSPRRCRRALAAGGVFASTDFGPRGEVALLALATWLPSKLGARQVMLPLPRYTKRDVLFLKELIEAGHYRPVIDRRYPLEEVVEATRYVETEQKVGNVVLTVVEPG
jgi:NADPH:quinone reductase-like Zn-dependent oxidoreductase